MSLPALPRSADSYARDRRAEIGAAVEAVRRQWRRMGDDFDVSYRAIEPTLLEVMDRAQERVAERALIYVPAVLEETGQRRAVAARFEPESTFMVGTTGSGLTTEGLAYESVIKAKTAVAAGATAATALAEAGSFLTLATATLLSDTARTAEKVAMHARPVTGYVRMLNPPSCGRCVVLAGKRSSSSTPFRRHPGCDCATIPVSESIAGEFTVDPTSYLDSLDDTALAKALGSQANAQAFRAGADPGQLVNAYRKSGGVRPAQVYGRNVKYTTEGVTRRGFAYSRMRGAGYAQAQTDVRDRGARYFQAKAPRLMPESIFQIAENKADADRLLRLYGWII